MAFNHNTIKAKIVAILKADTDLFTTTAEAGELRSIEVGFPSGNNTQGNMAPFAYVTNSPVTPETIKNQGSVLSNAIKFQEHIFDYDIAFLVDEHDSRSAELALDNLQEKITNTLEADTNLTGATTAEVDGSFLVRVARLTTPAALRIPGHKIQGRVITLRCSKVTS